jgi:hypothetical protein
MIKEFWPDLREGESRKHEQPSVGQETNSQ